MKNAILTIGLFTLVMGLTSFTTPEQKSTIDNNSPIEINGSSSVGGNKKVDINGSSSVGGNKKVDINGSSSVGGNKKVD
nr:3-oxoacyl-ACP reductase [uncultured Flavobacterium sp.]